MNLSLQLCKSASSCSSLRVIKSDLAAVYNFVVLQFECIVDSTWFLKVYVALVLLFIDRVERLIQLCFLSQADKFGLRAVKVCFSLILCLRLTKNTPESSRYWINPRLLV